MSESRLSRDCGCSLPRSSASTECARAGGTSFYLNVVCLVCSMGGFLFGYGSSCINVSMQFIQQEMHLTPEMEGLVTAIFMVGAAIGGIAGGRLADVTGRKRSLVLCDALYIVGTVCTGFAPSFWFLVPARMLLGIAAGGITSAAPVLLAEISTKETRSRNVTMSLLFFVFGELVIFVVGAVLGIFWSSQTSIWRWMHFLGLVPALALLASHALFVPESPRWLAQNGQDVLAFQTMRRLRVTLVETEEEMREISKVATTGGDEPGVGLWDILTVPWLRSILLVGIGIGLVQQTSGVVIGMLFGTTLLKEAGLRIELALLGNISIGLISFLAMCAGLWLVVRCGRRTILLIGQLGTVCMHVGIVICSALIPLGETRAWTTLGLLLPFLVFSQGSISTVTWLLMAEIFPLKLRGIGTGCCMLIAWGCACAVGQLFPIGTAHIGQSCTFSVFAAMGFVMLLFTWQFLPETFGKSLEQLEQQFQAGNWRALKNFGHNSPQVVKPINPE